MAELPVGDQAGVRALARKRLAQLDRARKGAGAAPGVIDIIWGWEAIADALGVNKKTAQRLHAEQGLPVDTDGPTVFTSRARLQLWADGELRRRADGSMEHKAPQRAPERV